MNRSWSTGPRRRFLIEAVVVCFAMVFAVLAIVEHGIAERTPSGGVLVVGLIVVAGLALVALRREPVVALLVIASARLLMTWQASDDVALIPAEMIALYVVTNSGERRTRLFIAISVAVVTMFVVAAFDSEGFFQELAGEAALMLLPIAVADGVRSRADRIKVLIDTEAESRVQAERLRIARDLHDVVAHGLSTIAIQSGVAAHLLGSGAHNGAAQAKESLEIINATGKRSLDELRAMVGVLRSVDDALPLSPAPSDPNDLSDVLAGVAHAGLTVTTEQHGVFPTFAGDACVVAVHRIIQEALTNVARHAGSVPVAIEVDHRTDEVRIRVSNGPSIAARNSTASTGVGIIGMTERAEALGGTLFAGPIDDGGFVVDATVPYRLPSEVARH